MSQIDLKLWVAIELINHLITEHFDYQMFIKWLSQTCQEIHEEHFTTEPSTTEACSLTKWSTNHQSEP